MRDANVKLISVGMCRVVFAILLLIGMLLMLAWVTGVMTAIEMLMALVIVLILMCAVLWLMSTLQAQVQARLVDEIVALKAKMEEE